MGVGAVFSSSRDSQRKVAMSDAGSRKPLHERIVAGSSTAAGEAFRKYYEQLWWLVKQQMSPQLRRREEPDDVLQSAFRSFFRGIVEKGYRIDHSGALWSLLAEITHKKLLKHAEYYNAAKRDPRPEVPTHELNLFAGDPAPSEVAAVVELIEQVLDGLDPLYGEVLHLRLQGCTGTEIAEKLGCTREVVRHRLRRIRERLTHLKAQESEK